MAIYPHPQKIKQVKYIVCDLDGTLFSTSGIVSKKSIDKLIQLQQIGYTLIIATGRFYYEIEGLVEQLQLEKFGGYAVNCNGLEIHDFKNKQSISFTSLYKKELHTLVKEAQNCGVSSYVNHNQKYHFLPCASHHMILSLAKIALYPAKLIVADTHKINKLYNVHITKTLDDTITQLPKICFIGAPQRLNRYKQSITQQDNDFAFYPSGKMVLEITHNSVGKHLAVHSICESNGHTLENVLAFGDSGNDYELLQQAGIGVTMKNGDAQCIKDAKYLSEYTNKEEGVLRYLDALQL